MRGQPATVRVNPPRRIFLRLRAGTFIEAIVRSLGMSKLPHFPAFGRGLSLRTHTFNKSGAYYEMFSPGGGAFIEAIKPLSRWAMFRHFSAFGRGLSSRPRQRRPMETRSQPFPHLRVGTFIEAQRGRRTATTSANFPAFGRGLSLRPDFRHGNRRGNWISPPSGGDFHRGDQLDRLIDRVNASFPAFGRGLSLRFEAAAGKHTAEGANFSTFRWRCCGRHRYYVTYTLDT